MAIFNSYVKLLEGTRYTLAFVANHIWKYDHNCCVHGYSVAISALKTTGGLCGVQPGTEIFSVTRGFPQNLRED